MPVKCIFSLNGKSLSHLDCNEIGTFTAFSGSGAFTNVPSAVGNKDNGPLPTGTYYIVDRESGGRLGFIRDIFKDFFSGTKRYDWFALYRDDGVIDDKTSVDGIIRGSFRLHPVGYWGISEGCITFPNVSEFYRLRKFLKSQPPAYINGIRYYGTLTVQ